MDPNLTTYYMAIKIESAWLPKQAERGWSLEQAITTQPPKREGMLAVRRWIGGLMVVIGQRLQGLPEPAIPSLDSAHGR
jgi:hypothetical protein